MPTLSRTLVAGLLVTALGAATGTARAADDRPWNLTLRGWTGYDSNVAKVADDDNTFDSGGKSSSNVYGGMLAGNYRLYREGRWQLTGNASILQTRNADRDLDAFDLTTVATGLSARYQFRLAGLPARLNSNLGLHWDWLGGDSYGNGQSLAFDLSVRPTRASELGWFASASHSNFIDDGSQPALSSRDGIRYASGFRGLVAFNGNRQALSSSVSWQENHAEGDNFDYRGPAASVQLTSYLVGPWAMALSGGYSRTEYTHYAVPPARESDNYNARLSVYGPLTSHLSADISLGWSRSKAEPDAFRSERKNLTVGVTYAF